MQFSDLFFFSSTDDIGYNEKKVYKKEFGKDKRHRIAQLGEGLNDIQEVLGSNLTISI